MRLLNHQSNRSIAQCSFVWQFCLLAVFMTACQVVSAGSPLPSQSVQPTASAEVLPTRQPTVVSMVEASPTKTSMPASSAVVASTALQPTTQSEPAVVLEPTPTDALAPAHQLSAEDWKEWQVIPQVPVTAREIYQRGLAMGNNPHAFSVLGDCQSLPETFMGVYDTDPMSVAQLSADLQATVRNFSGSFNRLSPTVKGGTTAGAILWAEWHENQYTCSAIETPLACELRLHNPSIVIINLGTHYETRNINYLRKIIDQLIDRGVLPILSTKADNRELDERLNLEMAQLAVEYNIPLWNFWAATLDLPNHGVGVKAGEEHLGEIYLSDEGLERHRLTALQALAAVWMAVR